jgi:hypothetical protein
MLGAVGRGLGNGVDPRIPEGTIVIEPIRRERHFIAIPLAPHNIAGCLVVLDAETTDLSWREMPFIGSNEGIIVLSTGSAKRERERFPIAVVFIGTVSALNIASIA